jgi:hypothetical protein
MKKAINKFTSKWFGIHPCITDVALYEKTVKLVLPLKYLHQGYKTEKASLVMMMENYTYVVVRSVAPNDKHKVL